jgi:hypothetical protein
MVDGLHILRWNRTKKSLVIALSGVGRRLGRGLRGRGDGGVLTSIWYKFNQNCHYESALRNEYILIKFLW